jgi:hypothetical protein
MEQEEVEDGATKMATVNALRVKYYPGAWDSMLSPSELIPNPYPQGALPKAAFHDVRNALVRACRQHGPTGPAGEFRVRKRFLHSLINRLFGWSKNASYSAESWIWQFGDRGPGYQIVDEQFSDDMYQHIELETPAAATVEWLREMTAVLAHHPGWAVWVNSITQMSLDCEHQGYAGVFPDRLVVIGPAFQACKDAADVVAALQTQIRCYESLPCVQEWRAVQDTLG